MERRINRQLLSYVLAFAMILSMLPVFSVTGHAAAENGDTIIVFTSDVHNEPKHEASDRLGEWIEAVNQYVGGTIDFMTFCGDMGKSGTESADGQVTGDYWDWTQAAIDVAEEKLGSTNVAFTTGNHEFIDGNYDTTTSTTKNKFSVDTLVKEAATYEIYCLGSTSSTQGYSTSQVRALETYFNGIEENSKKIFFIATHYPLHYLSYNGKTRKTNDAKSVIDTINAAVESKKIKVVVIWGHNHSESDPYYNEIFYPGENLKYDANNSCDFNFYYVPAGCMSDKENTTGHGDTIAPKGLVVRITETGKGFFSYFNREYKPIQYYGKTETPMSTLNSVTYAANGATEGTVPVDENEYETDALVTVSANTGNLTRTGYNFGGWTDGTKTYAAGDTFNITSDVTLKALWNPYKYTVKFLPGADDVTGSMEDQVFEYGESKKLTANTYEREYYTFAGWKDESNKSYINEHTVKDLATEDGAVVELTARWTSNFAPVSRVILNFTNLTLEVNSSKKLTATISPSDARQDVAWTSADPSIATVSEDGTISAVSVGKTTITATAKDGGKEASCTVTVKDELKEAKEAAVKEIDGFLTESSLAAYKPSHQEQIRQKAAEYKELIVLAKDIERIKDQYSQFLSKLKSIPTAAEVDKAEKEEAEKEKREQAEKEQAEKEQSERAAIARANDEAKKKVSSTKLSLKSVKAGKKKLTVKWTPKASVFAGYQISYRIKGKKWKNVNVSGAKKSSKVIKKLKKGKKYQVKVRGYKKVGDTTVYGKYSKTKTKKVK